MDDMIFHHDYGYRLKGMIRDYTRKMLKPTLIIAMT